MDGAPGRIFVQIASYRDGELVPTLRDCVAKAEHPERLRFGITWQRDDDDSLGEFASDPRVRVIDCHWRESLGVCWARHRLQQLYDGEELTLALDSHHRFVPGWDAELRRQLEPLGPMAVLTTYLPHYDPGVALDPDPAPVVLGADRFEPDGTFMYAPLVLDGDDRPTQPVLARFYSAHFACSRGSFLEDCPHDPELYFNGEEITLSVRAFTHGYDLYHPHKPVVFHRYGTEGRPIHWDDHDDASPTAAWRLDQLAKARVRALLGMDPATIDHGRYGLGTRRSLADYERFAGVEFASRTIHDDARRGRRP